VIGIWVSLVGWTVVVTQCCMSVSGAVFPVTLGDISNILQKVQTIESSLNLFNILFIVAWANYELPPNNRVAEEVPGYTPPVYPVSHTRHQKASSDAHL